MRWERRAFRRFRSATPGRVHLLEEYAGTLADQKTCGSPETLLACVDRVARGLAALRASAVAEMARLMLLRWRAKYTWGRGLGEEGSGRAHRLSSSAPTPVSTRE